jgi:AraC-like DNA-binding protein
MLFYLIGIIITFFLAVLLVTKKNKSKPDWILAIWLILVGIHLLLYYLFISSQYLEFPYFLGFDRPLPLLHGPLLYLYTAYSTQQIKNRYAWLHFLPWLLAHIPLIPFFLLPISDKIGVYNNQGAGYETISQILVWAIIASGVVYVILSLQLLRRHKRNIEQEFSNTVKINLAWLQYLIFGIGFIWLMVIVGEDPVVFGSVVLFVFFLGYFGIKQVGIFTHAHSHPTTTNPNNEKDDHEGKKLLDTIYPEVHEVKKYQKSGLNQEAAQEIHSKLSKVMENERLFKNPELTLPELSEKLEINPNILSQVINTQVGKSFYDYINSLRIDDFKKMVLLPENQKYSLLGLAMQCGFNSKTSFNRNFKKVTGLAPSEYLRQNNILLD